MADSQNGDVRRLVHAAWSAKAAPGGPDDPVVRGFAEFGLAPSSPLATEDGLRGLEAWRDTLRIPENSAFLDGTLIVTVGAVLSRGTGYFTPATLWELATFIDALVCFDRLYCIDSQYIDVDEINHWFGSEVLSKIPDPSDGMLRRLAAEAAANGLESMSGLRASAGSRDVFGQEVAGLVDAWRAVLGPDLPDDVPFDVDGLDVGLARMAAPATAPDHSRGTPFQESSSAIVDGDISAGSFGGTAGPEGILRILTTATRVPYTPADSGVRPPLEDRRRLAATATYRTYVNQGVANALSLPYLPSTLRMPFRRLFVQRAAEVQDELATVARADRIFAQQQPSAALTLPFFTSAVLRQARTRSDVWVQMAHVREQSAPFRRKRAEYDALLARSEVSPQALKLQAAIRDDALKLADLAGAAQQSASIALGVIAQTGIVPLAKALQVGVDAAQGVGRDSSWTRIWRRLFHRHEHFLAQANSQAIGLTNALPQIQQIWELPKIGGYLDRFARATQEMGHVLRDP
jgi:hypothetical protein